MEDITLKMNPEPGAECLIVRPGKGADGIDYICNEYLGST